MKESFLNFEQKVVVVTGGSKGIGRAILEQFLRYGAKCVMADVDEQGEQLADQLGKEGYEVTFRQCDVSKAEQVKKLIETVEGDFGGVDVLINNAGIFPRADLQNTDEAFWEKVLGINLKGTYLMCQAVVPGMIRRQGGSIVNIGSLHSTMGEESTMAYAVSKGGVVTLTRNLARALSKHRIRVNCIQPGWVASEGEVARWESSGLDSRSIQEYSSRIPLGGMQTGHDIACAAAFMASDLAGQVTGQILAVDGGLSLR
ncbi:SDR family NAD(P)-dependent oxidoreductase [Paenibacillus gansuensis]|uniref:SDR family NAD(P)-dependent oxidoreductase n=1 Tax=Paenibacillus gansuensis TaxID=306542 RepID=A0ABW5PBY3_9BACL